MKYFFKEYKWKERKSITTIVEKVIERLRLLVVTQMGYLTSISQTIASLELSIATCAIELGLNNKHGGPSKTR